MQSSDLFLSLSTSFCQSLDTLLAPVADMFVPFIETVGVVNFVMLMIVAVFCIVASAFRMHAPIVTVRAAREPKRWIMKLEKRRFIKAIRFSSIPSLMEEALGQEWRWHNLPTTEKAKLYVTPITSDKYVPKCDIEMIDVLDWEHCTEKLLSKNPRIARRARQAFITKELWRQWLNIEGLTSADRLAVYRLALAKKEERLVRQLLEELGWTSWENHMFWTQTLSWDSEERTFRDENRKPINASRAKKLADKVGKLEELL